jgi:hypothetical protein
MKTLALALSALISAVSGAVPVMAQQTTGVPGSPGGTTTIDGKKTPAARSEIRRLRADGQIERAND